MARKSSLTQRHKLTLIRSIILPILTYASISWGHKANITRKYQFTMCCQRVVVRQEYFHLQGSRADPNHRDDEEMNEFAKLNNLPNSHLRKLLDYDPRFVNKYEEPSNQILEIGKIKKETKYLIVYTELFLSENGLRR